MSLVCIIFFWLHVIYRVQLQRDEPPQKISKLAIAAETDEDRYVTKTRVVCYPCCQNDLDASRGRLPAVIDGVMKAMTFSKREEVKAWEQEFIPCEHTINLIQGASRQIESKGAFLLFPCINLIIMLTIGGQS